MDCQKRRCGGLCCSHVSPSECRRRMHVAVVVGHWCTSRSRTEPSRRRTEEPKSMVISAESHVHEYIARIPFNPTQSICRGSPAYAALICNSVLVWRSDTRMIETVSDSPEDALVVW
ncbi:hypothetical protein DAEQUDRAFT_552508 [Daedalea quercina L-15889]|uniref:Uncharacterized protein n=1 Tax=Daedalea quercina L-15889 TaxID=1314783 RepID=A0A165T401_9APHY|nr:hypothetical protein DAEQUDRAFT_552508 [Daedalea quercina L-15889]